MPAKARILSSKTLYRGRVFDLRRDTLIEPGGLKVTREIVRHRGSVVILPVLPDHRVILVRQYRQAVGQALWELVAGSLEPGERPLEGAKRELLEETGYKGRNFKRLLSFYPSPGFLTERMDLFTCRVSGRPKPRPEPDERIECRAFSPPGLASMVRTSRIKDGKTLIGLLWFLPDIKGR